jgi:hypothetical protein
MHSASRRSSSKPDGGISGPGTIHGTLPGYRAGRKWPYFCAPDWSLTSGPTRVRASGPAGELVDQMNATGAVLVGRIEPEIARVIDTPQATHIRYRIRR